MAPVGVEVSCRSRDGPAAMYLNERIALSVLVITGGDGGQHLEVVEVVLHVGVSHTLAHRPRPRDEENVELGSNYLATVVYKWSTFEGQLGHMLLVRCIENPGRATQPHPVTRASSLTSHNMILLVEPNVPSLWHGNHHLCKEVTTLDHRTLPRSREDVELGCNYLATVVYKRSKVEGQLGRNLLVRCIENPGHATQPHPVTRASSLTSHNMILLVEPNVPSLWHGNHHLCKEVTTLDHRTRPRSREDVELGCNYLATVVYKRSKVEGQLGRNLLVRCIENPGQVLQPCQATGPSSSTPSRILVVGPKMPALWHRDRHLCMEVFATVSMCKSVPGSAGCPQQALVHQRQMSAKDTDSDWK